MKELNLALHALCDELNVPPPAPDAKSRYALQVGNVVLRLAPSGANEVVLEGVILQLEPETAANLSSQQDLSRQLMAWNLARLKGQGRLEVLSYDEQENQLILWRSWLRDDRLPQRVLRGAEQMLNELDFWQSAIFALRPGLAPKATLP
ncbi:MAG: hypothetical protein RIQ93_2088 [Verrucomicrobiota bacterium]|jgi:hypothetical protein